MIITIIAIALFVIGVVLLIVASNNDWDCELTGIGIGILTFPLLVCLVAITTAQIGREVEYEKKLHERNMLVYRLEQAEEDNNVVEYAELYNDIVHYNNSIRKCKVYGNNPWLNWFHNPLLANLDYIEVISTEESK